MNKLRTLIAQSGLQPIFYLRRAEELIGCMTDRDLLRCWYNGTTADRALQPTHTPSLLEQHNVPPKEISEQRWYSFIMDETSILRQDQMRQHLAEIAAKYAA